MLFVLLSKRFLHMTVLDGFAFVAIHANLLDRYSFTNRFHYLLDTLLNKPVPYTRDTQGPCLAGVVWLRYLLAPYWFGAIPIFASIYNKSYFFDHFIGGTFSDVLDCEVVCSACLTYFLYSS